MMVNMREGSNIDEDEILVTGAAPQSYDMRLYENIREHWREGEVRRESRRGERKTRRHERIREEEGRTHKSRERA